MPARIRLIATDLDGTLIGSVNEIPLYARFRDVLQELRGEDRCLWAACTGRGLRGFSEFFTPLRASGVMPDFIIIRHAYIYGVRQVGFVPHMLWNMSIRRHLWLNRLRSRSAVREWHALIRGGALGVKTLVQDSRHLRLRFDSLDSAAAASDMLKVRLSDTLDLHVFKFENEVEVRPIPFTKGLAVKELARHLDIPAGYVLAVGDGQNDISMFDRGVAAMTGCPANAHPEVMQAVHEAGGHISEGRALAGVLDVIEAHRRGAVHSELPSWWRPPVEAPFARRSRREKPRRRSAGRMPKRISRWFLALLAYTVLLVFASFDLIPFSDAIMKPCIWLAEGVQCAVSFLWP